MTMQQLVDQLYDVGATIATLTRPARRSMRTSLQSSLQSAGVPTAASEQSEVPAVLSLGSVSRGGTATAGLNVINVGNSRVDQHTNDGPGDITLELASTPFTSGETDTIPPSALTVAPVPVMLYPRSSRIVDVSIAVPSDASPGRYIGLLTASGRTGVQTVVAFEVT